MGASQRPHDPPLDLRSTRGSTLGVGGGVMGGGGHPRRASPQPAASLTAGWGAPPDFDTVTSLAIGPHEAINVFAQATGEGKGKEGGAFFCLGGGRRKGFFARSFPARKSGSREWAEAGGGEAANQALW